MSAELVFYLDEAGVHRARGDDERLARYLETDIQGSIARAEELIELLEDADFSGDFVGNAHCVDFRAKSVSIDAMNDSAAPDRVVSREDMLRHVQAWLDFISVPAST